MSSVWSIRRSAADKKLAGVCGGVARHWNVDPVLVRVGWVLLALSGGVGIVLYVAAWLLVPADGSTSSTMDDLTKGATRGWPREAWVAIVAIACLITFGIFSSTTTIGFGPAVVLALIWYFGYYKTRVKKAPPPSPGPTGPADRPRAGTHRRAVPLPRPGDPLHRGGRSLAAAGGGHAPPGPARPRAVAPGRTSSVSRCAPPPAPADAASAVPARSAPTWQTYPTSSGTVDRAGPGESRRAGGRRPRRLPRHRRPGRALHRGRPAPGRSRPEPAHPGAIAVGPTAAPRRDGGARTGAARAGHRRLRSALRSPR